MLLGALIHLSSLSIRVDPGGSDLHLRAARPLDRPVPPETECNSGSDEAQKRHPAKTRLFGNSAVAKTSWTWLCIPTALS